MGRVSQAAPQLSVAQVQQKIKKAPNYWLRQKWLVIYNALIDPRPAKEIATHTGMSVASVHKVISEYNRLGTAAIETPGKGGRRNYYLSWVHEKEFLADFFKKAASGQIATGAEIKLAYEKLVGHTVHKTTIYRLLDRHQWRKIVPRPCHVKADKQEQEAFKKTFNQKSNNS